MAWYTKNTNELWTGDTHTLHGWTWTEATHMSYSIKLVEGPEPEKKAAPKRTAPKRAAPKKVAKE